MLSTKKNRWRFVRQKFATWLIPYRCILCQNKTTRDLDLCWDCEIDLPWIKNSCVQCAVPLPNDSQHESCGQCLVNPPFFTKTTSLFHYRYPIDYLITQLKFHNKLLPAKILGQLLAKELVRSYDNKKMPDVIIPIPLHDKRLKQRGYNQALELAHELAKTLQIPINIRACKRIRPTLSQSTLSANMREANVKNSFQMTANANDLEGKYILAVDDVLTTSHTMRAFCKCLFNFNVREIDVACIARTSLK